MLGNSKLTDTFSIRSPFCNKVGIDGKLIQPTNKSFKVDFCTVAHWKDEKILEENLFYDVVGMMRQLGLM